MKTKKSLKQRRRALRMILERLNEALEKGVDSKEIERLSSSFECLRWAEWEWGE